MKERTRRRRRKKKSGAEAHGLEKLQALRGLIDVEDGRVAVDLSKLVKGGRKGHLQHRPQLVRNRRPRTALSAGPESA